MQGFAGFKSWDETYVHTKHNDRGRTVLEERVEGEHHEPWTWVRTKGQGRVFYTAWGHDQRTWSHPGFHNLVERGIRFAAGRDPQAAGPYVDHLVMTKPPAGLKAFEYQPAKVAFYSPPGHDPAKKNEPLGPGDHACGFSCGTVRSGAAARRQAAGRFGRHRDGSIGPAARGKAVFKEQCGKCHMHSGEGGKVGPELTGMAVHPAKELLIHVLDPR